MLVPPIPLIDTLIVGQGLAGSLLALALLKQGNTVCIIDDGHKSSATKVAAGLINPVTGKRLVPTWQNPNDIHTVVTHYRHVEHQLNTPLLREVAQIRILKTPNERLAYDRKATDPTIAHHMSPLSNTTLISNLTITPQDIPIQVSPTYILDTPALLNQCRDILHQQESIITDTFQYTDLVPTKSHVQWKNIRAKRLVFCEGYRSEFNPFFPELTFENAKGEIIEFSSDTLSTTTVINAGKWIVPRTSGHFKFGATSYWDYHDHLPEPKSSQSLKTDLDHLVQSPHHIRTITAGIRPVLKTRTPLFAQHAEKLPLYIITGLGSKGTFHAPHLITKALSKLMPNALGS